MKRTDIVVKNLIKPGGYTDDQTKGLHLWVKDLAKKYWIPRYAHEGIFSGSLQIFSGSLQMFLSDKLRNW